MNGQFACGWLLVTFRFESNGTDPTAQYNSISSSVHAPVPAQNAQERATKGQVQVNNPYLSVYNNWPARDLTKGGEFAWAQAGSTGTAAALEHNWRCATASAPASLTLWSANLVIEDGQ
ncbi:hypothetical protein EVAR_97346_1 [Eumeta japonica]|uniref:Uncharacterized protein n=1 Tax=Eumeta variegata TaxID=151549 RepID=A0A4C1X5E2_EUMVA|nr:hypothetical protein EVAR_97346_1 [Eumeta japonica]